MYIIQSIKQSLTLTKINIIHYYFLLFLILDLVKINYIHASGFKKRKILEEEKNNCRK